MMNIVVLWWWGVFFYCCCVYAVSVEGFLGVLPSQSITRGDVSRIQLQSETRSNNAKSNTNEFDEEATAVAGRATTLDGRLLCAAECAYTIEQQYFRGVGYKAGTQVKRLSKGTNSCLVGLVTNPNSEGDGSGGDDIVIAFRGTQFGAPLDWLQNAGVYLQRVPTTYVPAAGAAGTTAVPRVHEGFYSAMQSLATGLKTVLLDLLQTTTTTTPAPKIYITGHSKGGSLALLYGLLLVQDPELPNPERITTFAPARVGNTAFADYYNSLLGGSTTICYENDLDLIPFLPPGQTTMDDIAALSASQATTEPNKETGNSDEDPNPMMDMVNE